MDQFSTIKYFINNLQIQSTIYAFIHSGNHIIRKSEKLLNIEFNNIRFHVFSNKAKFNNYIRNKIPDLLLAIRESNDINLDVENNEQSDQLHEITLFDIYGSNDDSYSPNNQDINNTIKNDEFVFKSN